MPALLVALILLATATTPVESWMHTRTVVVRGTVTHATTGAPLARASVSATLGTTTSTILGTPADGSYLIRISGEDTAGTVSLRVRALGFKPAVLTASAESDTIVMNVTMTPDVARLEEIVVTATAEAPQEKRSLPFTAVVGGLAQGSADASTARLRSTATRDHWNTEEYSRIEDNRFLSVASAPLSTFSVDVDRASYSNVRRFINGGTLPPKDAVRIEEMINYFPYAYREPTGGHPVSITTDIAAAPWNPSHRIVRIGLNTKRVRTEKLPPNNLVFLIDVSGSMAPANKLPLVKQAFRLLVNELREQDRIAIVVYAGNAGLVLPSTSAADKQIILDAIERLEAGGSTAGGAGIRLAYDVAKQNFAREGNNRVIWATDGDFNVGVSSTSELTRLVEERRAEGTALTLLGFGMGNYKDGRLEQLADKGNGNYAYVDDLLEARKVLVQEMGATLLTVAKDVKLQVEFNPAAVQAYRLIGYENRLLRNEDFTDDQKDAGEIGAGHSVTALYEIIPVGVKLDVDVGTTGSLRYQAPSAERRAPRAGNSRELLHVNIRYKAPTESASRLLQHAVLDRDTGISDDLRFAMAVAGYGMVLRDSEYKGRMTYDFVLMLAKGAAGEDRLRADFVSLVEKTRQIAAGVAVREDR
jgi:Ca-activated chloride channel family protein